MFTPQAAIGAHFKAHIGMYKGRVVLDFGVQLSHLELEPREARQIADLLLKHALRAELKPDALEAK